MREAIESVPGAFNLHSGAAVRGEGGEVRAGFPVTQTELFAHDRVVAGVMGKPVACRRP